MRISDWSSDVCSSDLLRERAGRIRAVAQRARAGVPESARAGPDPGQPGGEDPVPRNRHPGPGVRRCHLARRTRRDRKSAVEGKCVSVLVESCGGRIIKKKNKNI